jgi:hypothetical protein
MKENSPLSCINMVFVTSMPARIWRERSTAEFPMMSFLSIRPGFHFETESTASDMSDLSYEQELGEVGEIDEGPLQHCRKLTT